MWTVKSVTGVVESSIGIVFIEYVVDAIHGVCRWHLERYRRSCVNLRANMSHINRYLIIIHLFYKTLEE